MIKKDICSNPNMFGGELNENIIYKCDILRERKIAYLKIYSRMERITGVYL